MLPYPMQISRHAADSLLVACHGNSFHAKGQKQRIQTGTAEEIDMFGTELLIEVCMRPKLLHIRKKEIELPLRRKKRQTFFHIFPQIQQMLQDAAQNNKIKRILKGFGQVS